MKIWQVVVLAALVQPISSQVSPKHQTTDKNQTHSSETKRNGTQPGSPIQVTTKETAATASENTTQTNQYESRPEFKWGLTRAEFIMAALTAVYVTLTLVYVIVASRTLSVLNRQALSMRRQTTQMRRAAISASRSAIAAKKSAEFAEFSVRSRMRTFLCRARGLFPPDLLLVTRSSKQGIRILALLGSRTSASRSNAH